MARDDGISRRSAFYLAMGLAGALGIGLILGYEVLVSRLPRLPTAPPSPPIGVELLRDVGVALVVAVVTGVTIEAFVTSGVRREIAHNVFRALFKQFLPQPVESQVRDAVLRSQVVRRDWAIEMRVLDLAVDGDVAGLLGPPGGNMCVIEYTVSYKLENLSAKWVDYIVQGGIDLDAVRVEDALPRFRSILIDSDHRRDNPVSSLADKDAAGLLIDPEKVVRLANGLELRQDHGELIFERTVRLPPRMERSTAEDERARVSICYQVWRPLPIPGMLIWASPSATDGVCVSAPPAAGVRFEVTVLHPNFDEVKQSGSRWRLERGFLPWQSVVVRAHRVRAEHNGAQPHGSLMGMEREGPTPAAPVPPSMAN